MKKLFNISAILIVLFFAACASSEKPAETSADTTMQSTESTAAAVYTCPMHPEVISDMPGSCPVCKMDLVVKTDDAGNADSTVKDSSHADQQH
jgi:Cu(I)/Ag(I) efflux system membrane fusion protein